MVDFYFLNIADILLKLFKYNFIEKNSNNISIEIF